MILRLRRWELICGILLMLGAAAAAVGLLIEGVARTRATVVEARAEAAGASHLSPRDLAWQWARLRESEGVPPELIHTPPEDIRQLSDEAFEQIKRANRLDVNLATTSELQRIPGIGPTRAKAIVAYRRSVGRIERIEELARISGISAKLARKLDAYLQVRPVEVDDRD